jgi:glycosyltransferase involved in cell wall biosynthesis
MPGIVQEEYLNLEAANKSSRRYCVITPCRNEESHLKQTIRSVTNQTIVPACWVIVDDGSSDNTPQIIEQAMKNISFIQVVRREDRGKRSVGPGVIEAFYAGLETVDLDHFDYVCKLDADVELPRRYFERLMEEMESEPWLGTISGKVFIRDNSGRDFHEVRGDENSVGPSKFYRIQAFRDIGGFVRHVGWDGVDGHQCRAMCWVAKSLMHDELKIIHRRLMGSSDHGVYRGRIRGGFGLWFIGNSLIYVLARSIARLREKPLIIGSLCTLYGYILAFLTQRERYGDDIYRQAVRKFERRALLHGKRRAIEICNKEIIEHRHRSEDWRKQYG